MKTYKHKITTTDYAYYTRVCQLDQTPGGHAIMREHLRDKLSSGSLSLEQIKAGTKCAWGLCCTAERRTAGLSTYDHNQAFDLWALYLDEQSATRSTQAAQLLLKVAVERDKEDHTRGYTSSLLEGFRETVKMGLFGGTCEDGSPVQVWTSRNGNHIHISAAGRFGVKFASVAA